MSGFLALFFTQFSLTGGQVAGPFCPAAQEVFVAGGQRTRTFVAGAEASEVAGCQR